MMFQESVPQYTSSVLTCFYCNFAFTVLFLRESKHRLSTDHAAVLKSCNSLRENAGYCVPYPVCRTNTYFSNRALRCQSKRYVSNIC